MNRPAASPVLQAPPYTATQWAVRKQFVMSINDICARENISVEWLSEYWVARLERAGAVKFIVGFSFPVNDAGGAAVARDKVATYQVLSHAGIPAVPHWPLHFPDNTSGRESIRKQAAAALELTSLPMVVKPCSESGGKDVYKVTTLAALTSRLVLLAAHYRVAAVSQFYSGDEYRVIMSGSHARIIFRKVPSRTARAEWRHNLSLGSLPDPVTDPALKRQLTDLARRTMAEMGLTMAAVDIIQTADGPRILEVNAGFSMHYASRHPAFSAPTQALYEEAIGLTFA